MKDIKFFNFSWINLTKTPYDVDMAKHQDMRRKQSREKPEPAQGTRTASVPDPPPPLSDVLRGYLTRLGSPSDRIIAESLAERLKVGREGRVRLSAGLINQWKNGHKAPSRRQLVEMARFICELSKSQMGRQSDLISLDTVLYELLAAARMSFNTPDFIGDRVSESQVEARRSGSLGDVLYTGLTDTDVATVPQITLAAVKAPPFIDVGGTGLCGEIASYVVKLMGAEPVWVTTDWENLRRMLETREVDLIPPLLFIAPTRIHDFTFSEPIGLIAGFKAVVPKGAAYSACVDAQGLNPSRVEVISIAGEIGQLFCRISGAARSHEEVATHADAGRRLLESSRHWTRGRAVPVLVTETATCNNLIADHSTHFAGADLRPEHHMRFPFAFGMRDDEPTLQRAVNVAIRDLKRTGMLGKFILRYRDELGSTVWVDDDVQISPRTAGEFCDLVSKSEKRQRKKRQPKKHQSKEPKS